MNDKKITLKQFFESDIPSAIHCNTEEKLNKLCEAFDKIGKRWKDDTSYMGDTKWDKFKEKTCYSNLGRIKSKKLFSFYDIPVYEFEDITFDEGDYMNDNVKKVFEILGIEPMQNFQLEFKNGHISGNYRLDNELFGYYGDCRYPDLLRDILVGEVKVIKSTKKKKLRNLTMDEYKKWENENCPKTVCSECPFHNVCCNSNDLDFWLRHKELYSDKFLDQEVEVE